MNLYFLVEGKRTETKVYPKWLSVLVPGLEQVDDAFEIINNQYYLFSGGGYPNILDDMVKAIRDINDIMKYDYFVVCLDADDFSIEERISEIKKRIESEGLSLKAQLIIIIQNRCFETWFLGNSKVYTRNPQGEFLEYSKFYDVSENDPELMGKMGDFEESVSKFHEKYLEKMLAERNIRYTKARPYSVCEETYIAQLKRRVRDTNDLNTLKEFFDFCERLNKEMA